MQADTGPDFPLVAVLSAVLFVISLVLLWCTSVRNGARVREYLRVIEERTSLDLGSYEYGGCSLPCCKRIEDIGRTDGRRLADQVLEFNTELARMVGPTGTVNLLDPSIPGALQGTRTGVQRLVAIPAALLLTEHGAPTQVSFPHAHQTLPVYAMQTPAPGQQQGAIAGAPMGHVPKNGGAAVPPYALPISPPYPLQTLSVSIRPDVAVPPGHVTDVDEELKS